MIRKSFLLLSFALMTLTAFSQSINDDFFTKVSYVGAFGSEDWTQGWANFDPINTNYPTPTVTKGNGDFTQAGGTKITANETWSGVVKLDGFVYVQSGATLIINPGTIIRGTEKSCLVIERGAKIMAEGTSSQPIVFTSMKAAGSRWSNDWAGLIICGKAPNNKGNDVLIEGGVGATFGGNVADDNSGVLKYVRIEFPGYDIDGNGNEINGLTLGSVGSKTVIDYVQVSYSGDDAFEWFGGTVNAKHLIAFSTEDDDFDTDNGFGGMVQFGVIVRNPDLSDTDTANGFESDNDASGSAATPLTSAIFSNITIYGPVTDNSTAKNHGYGLRLRRNTSLKLYNSVITGTVKNPVFIDGAAAQANALAGNLTIKNTVIAAANNKFFKTDYNATAQTGWTYAAAAAWFMGAGMGNDTVAAADLKINAPLTITAPAFIPQAGSPVLESSVWSSIPVQPGTINDDFFTKVSYVGAFGSEDWTQGWANFDPINTNYPTPTVTKGNGDFTQAGGTKITANETWSGVVKLDGFVYVQSGATLIINPGTIIRGTEKSCLVIERGAKIMAEGTSSQPIVFTSMKAAGSRWSNDWAGLIICGKAPNNKGNDVLIEGGVGATFGGNVADDNSGVLKYVRIEFPGYDIDGNGNEINGLTLGSVGSKTVIDYVQVSYSGDDAFEWFGGTVNAKHLIAFSTEDDDFDTDNGFGGMVQFGVIVRNPDLSDTDTANGFESDNDASGSAATPLTSAIFSNITIYGPVTDNSTAKNHGYGLRLRRNTSLKLYNSVITGTVKNPVFIDGAAAQANALAGNLTIKNTVIAAANNKFFKTDYNATAQTGWTYAAAAAWFMGAGMGNDTVAAADLKINAPLTITAPAFIPQAGSPVLESSVWAATPVKSVSKMVTNIAYPNPFSNTIYFSNDVQIKSVIITNIMGQMVKQVTVVGNSMDVSDLKSGNYMIIATEVNGNRITNKMLKL